jgi:hypothetical protein
MQSVIRFIASGRRIALHGKRKKEKKKKKNSSLFPFCSLLGESTMGRRESDSSSAESESVAGDNGAGKYVPLDTSFYCVVIAGEVAPRAEGRKKRKCVRLGIARFFGKKKKKKKKKKKDD